MLGERQRAYFHLAVTIVLAGLSAPLIKWLVVHGGKLGISRPDAISYCNVFFVGNTCAGIGLLLRSGARGIVDDLRGQTQNAYLSLAATVMIAGFLVPTTLYIALEFTSATNVVLLLRVESVAFVALGALLFHDRVSRMTWVGLAGILAGSVALAFVQGDGSVSKGDALALTTGLLYAVGSTLSRFTLKTMSVETLLFVRNLFGAVVFFFIAIVLYGPEHFMDAFVPELWLIMTVYALVVVVIGQMTWFRSVKELGVATVSSWDSLTPIAGIAFAALLLAEEPDMSQWVGATIIVGCVAIARWPTREDHEAAGGPERSIAGG